MGLNATLYNSTYGQGIVLPIRPGAVFREEYNEILDSATLIVSQRTTKIVISPFDLVVVTGDNFVTRRLVVDTVTERIISFDPLIYDYQINLFSETKLLEHYVLPNLSITQPANKTQKKSISFYLLKYLQMYGPNRRRKKPLAPTEWTWASRFSFNSLVIDFFNNIECPEFQWNQPTLREVFTDLMMVADRIPVLKDNVISFINITAIGLPISLAGNTINFVEKTITSTDAVTQLRLNMENALTPKIEDLDVVTRKVEFLGFRNSNSSVFLDTENLEIVTDNPIYKLLRVTAFLQLPTFSGNSYVFTELDITNHCVEKSIYDTLSSEAKSLGTYTKNALDINKKQFNVYYSRGGRTISGWAQKVNIGNFLLLPFNEFPIESILTFILGYEISLSGDEIMDMVFRVEYETQGSVVADIGRTYLPNFNERTTFDNQTNAYVDVIAQGKFTQTKVNRLGNDVLMISGRYNTDNVVPSLSQTFDTDYIIFSREVSVFDDYVSVKFMAAKDYVLRDYFTGVSSRKRNFALDTANSFIRHDLAKFYAEFSFFPKFEKVLNNLDNILPVNLIPFNWQLAKAKPIITASLRTSKTDGSGSGFPTFPDWFGLELDKKISGNSLLLTIAAKDNVSIGEKLVIRNVLGTNRRVQETYFYADNVNGECENPYFGLIDEYSIGQGAANFPVPQQYNSSPMTTANTALINTTRLKPIFSNLSVNAMDVRRQLPIYKDNKEILKITTQIEFCADSRDIVFTDAFLRYQKFVNEKDYNEIKNFAVTKQSFYRFVTNFIGPLANRPGADLDAAPFVGFSIFYQLSDGSTLRIKEAVSQINLTTQLPYWQDAPFTFNTTNLSGGSSYAPFHKIGNKYGSWNGFIDNSGFENAFFVEFDNTGVWPDANDNYVQIVSTSIVNVTSLAQLKTLLPPINYRGGMVVVNIFGIGAGVYFALPVGSFNSSGQYVSQTWEWVRKDNVITNLLDANRVFVNFQGSTRYRWTGAGFSALVTNNLPVGWKIYLGTTSAHRYNEYDVLPKGNDTTTTRQVTITSINSLTSRINLTGSSTGVTSWAITNENNKLLFAVNGNNFIVYLNVLNSRDTRVFDLNGDIIVGTINNTTNDIYAV